jgi:hypothetical protein
MTAPHPRRCTATENRGHGFLQQCRSVATEYVNGAWWCRRHAPRPIDAINTDRAQLAALGATRGD